MSRAENPHSISVILPSYNGRDYIELAIESILGQTRTPDEILVIDDGSTDGTAEWVEEKFPSQLRLIRQENRGVAATRNLGLRQTRGELIALIDQDDVWLPRHLERLADCLTDDPRRALVFSRHECIDRDGEVIRGGPLPEIPEDAPCAITEANFIQSPSLIMVRREPVLSVGGFVENLEGAGADDWGLYIRLLTRFPFARDEEVTVHYRVHDHNYSHRVDQMMACSRSLIDLCHRDPEIRPFCRMSRTTAIGRHRLYYQVLSRYERSGSGWGFFSDLFGHLVRYPVDIIALLRTDHRWWIVRALLGDSLYERGVGWMKRMRSRRRATR